MTKILMGMMAWRCGRNRECCWLVDELLGCISLVVSGVPILGDDKSHWWKYRLLWFDWSMRSVRLTNQSRLNLTPPSPRLLEMRLLLTNENFTEILSYEPMPTNSASMPSWDGLFFFLAALRRDGPLVGPIIMALVASGDPSSVETVGVFFMEL